jgi:hypothetical protein
MSPLIFLHATAHRHRDSIREYGLLISRPNRGRPWGVYVFRDDYGHPSFSRSRTFPFTCWWGWHPPSDLWQAAYIGPLSEDRYVENGWILHELVPPQHLSLITPITPLT